VVAPGALAGHRLIGLDTALFVYDWEFHPTFGAAARAVSAAIESGELRAVASTLLLGELLVRPFPAGRADVAAAYRDRLSRYPNLSLVAPDSEICTRAAELRALAPRLRLPDAVHVATALSSGATAFVTNDFDLRADLGIAVIQLSELPAGA
jgi:predicted nucleic acid-binding protein